jgi:hypothetical protein
VAETNGLLNRRRVLNSTESSNLSPSAPIALVSISRYGRKGDLLLAPSFASNPIRCKFAVSGNLVAT